MGSYVCQLEVAWWVFISRSPSCALFAGDLRDHVFRRMSHNRLAVCPAFSSSFSIRHSFYWIPSRFHTKGAIWRWGILISRNINIAHPNYFTFLCSKLILVVFEATEFVPRVLDLLEAHSKLWKKYWQTSFFIFNFKTKSFYSYEKK